MQLMIRQESDLYNPYDPTQTRINDRVYQYLRSYCTELHYRDHLHDTLRICTDGPVDADRFRTALLDAVQEDRSEFDRMLAENKRRVIWEYFWIRSCLPLFPFSAPWPSAMPLRFRRRSTMTSNA